MGKPSLRAVEVFCAVVEAGNFTAAAVELGVTPAAVSRAIANHEASVGVQLFRRTTRSMRLTEEGQGYFESCRQALSLVEQAERTLSQRQTAPRGKVRISMPTTYGHYRALSVVATFCERYPDVVVEANVSNRNVDFVAEGYDLAIRAGELADSTLVARKLEDAALGVFCSPTYLRTRSAPKDPAALGLHRTIGFVRPSTGRLLTWLFREKDGTAFEVPIQPSVRCSDDFLGCVTLARAGAGLVQTFRFIAEQAVSRGELIEVLKPYAGRSRPFTLLSPAGRVPTLGVRLFAEALLAACAPAARPRQANPARVKS